MQIETLSTAFALARASNVTSDDTLPTPAVLDAAPPDVAANGWLAIGAGGGLTSNGLQLMPFGKAATGTYVLYVYGLRWLASRTGDSGKTLWVPYLLASFNVTLGTMAGVDGTPVDSTNVFATTIALIAGTANVSNEIVSPASNLPAHIMVDTKGSKYIKTVFDLTTATEANALFARV